MGIGYGRRSGKAILRGAGLCLFLTAIVLGGYLGFLRLSGNFHTVIPGELYRSAQPSAAQLKDYVARYGIRTVINLRGASQDDAWYREEIATARALGVDHVDFAMSASSIVTADAIDRLTDIMRTAQKPILIHCKAGADRSGIASAIYSYAIAGKDEDTAERQISLYFGHIGIPYLSATYAMDDSWERFEERKGIEK